MNQRIGPVLPAFAAPGIPWTGYDHWVASAVTLLTISPYLRAFFGFSEATYLLPLGMMALATLFRMRNVSVRLSRAALIQVLLFLSLAAWLLISINWTSAVGGSYEYAFHLLGLTVLSALLLGSITARSTGLIVRYLAVAGFLCALHVVGGHLAAGDFSGRSPVVRASYLVTSFLMGVGSISALAVALDAPRRRLFWGFIALTNYLALGLSMGRGALLFGILSGVLVGALQIYRVRSNRSRAFQPRTVRWKTLGLALLFVTALGTSMFAALNVGMTQSRLTRLFSGDEFQTTQRIGYWTDALNAFLHDPIAGQGLGSSTLAPERSSQAYPHNFILQVAVDGGLVGLFFLFGFIAVPVGAFFERAILRRKVSLLQAGTTGMLGVFVFCLLEFSKSYDFYTARPLVMFAMLATVSLSSISARRASGVPGELRQRKTNHFQ